MHTIELNGMTFFAYHGVMPQERAVGNIYTVDLKISLNLTAAIESDNLADTINYAALYEIIRREMNISSNLIEYVAGRTAASIRSAFPQIKTVELRLAKTRPPIEGDIREAAVTVKLG